MSISSIPILTLVTFLPLIGALVVAVAPERYARRPRAGDRARDVDPVAAAPHRVHLRRRPRPALPVRRRGAVDPGVRDPVQARRRRALADPRRPDDDAVVDRDPVLVRPDQGPHQALHDVVPHPRGRPHRGLRRARPVPLLHLLGDRPRPDVPDHRDLGRRNRIYATIKFVLYTLVGSLLMLVAILATGFATSRPPGLGQRVRLRGAAQLRDTSGLRRRAPAARVPRLLPRVRDQGPDVPVPHLAAGRPRRGPDGRLRDPCRDHAEAGRLRLHPLRAAAVPRRRPHLRAA